MRHGGSRALFCRTGLRTGALLILGAMALAGCSSTLASLPAEMGGLPADAPARPEGEAPAFPAVHDMPPPRQTSVMTPEQIKQTEAEMVRARDRQTGKAR